MEWSATKEQVFAFESDIVVSAGAGSGKTAALVELYLRLLAGETRYPRQLTAEEMVAITFTDKAALEMRDRVRKGMAARLSAGGDPLIWKANLRLLPSAPISTFHSFCARLLRENPAEAGIDPAFSLLDELAACAELRGALDEVIEEELASRSNGVRLLLEQYPLSGAGRGKGLREHLLDLRRKRSSSGKRGEELLRIMDQWDREARTLFQAGRNDLGALVREAERVLGGEERAFHLKLRGLPDLHHRDKLDPESDETPARLTAMGACIGGNWGKETELKNRLEECLDLLGLAFRQIRSAPLAATILNLSEKVEESFRRRKERRGALDFDDLQVRTRDLLRNDASVRAECRRRFPVIMVDEFQDTNPLQKELLELLCGEEQRLFIVGDPKQSIYLFRGADVSVFGRAQAETVSRGGSILYFQESFRSRQGIIAFVNSLFSVVMGGGTPLGLKEQEPPSFDVRYADGDHLQPMRMDGDDGTSCVELLALDPDESGGTRRRNEARAIAQKILSLTSGEEGVQFGEIAILFRRFTHLKIFERELRRCAIPYYVVKGKGFYRCQEVLDLLNFLRYLEFSGDLSALAGLLRSPLCGVSDETLYLLSRQNGGIGAWEKNSAWDRIDLLDRGKLNSLALLMGRLRPLRDRLTLAELMEEILTGTDFASSLYATFQGVQKGANLRKLIELSRSFTGESEGGLRGFIAYLTEQVDIEPTEAEAVISAEGENVVRLMTVHQSKGLEFPVVFIPELGAGAPADHAPVQYDDTLGIGVKYAGEKGKWEPTLASRAIGALRSRKESAELKRLFYVATTRARDYLVLSGEKVKNRSAPWREWLDTFLAGEGASLVRVTGADSRTGDGEVPQALVAGGGGNILSDSAGISEGIDRSLRFVPPLPSSMIFSPTALEDYVTCPRKYFYKGVMGLDEGLFAEMLGSTGRGRTWTGGGMTPLEKGDLAHLLLERIDFAADSAAVRRAGLLIAATAAPDPDDGGVNEVVDAVVSFAASLLGRNLRERQTLRECPFTLKLAGDAAYYVRGAMDLVVPEADLVTVYDYKYMNKEDGDLAGYHFQLRTYMLALAKAWPGRRIGGTLLFLKGGGEEAVECDVPAFEAELVRIMDAIRQRSREEDFGQREGCDGRHCPFRQRCLKKPD